MNTGIDLIREIVERARDAASPAEVSAIREALFDLDELESEAARLGPYEEAFTDAAEMIHEIDAGLKEEPTKDVLRHVEQCVKHLTDTEADLK